MYRITLSSPQSCALLTLAVALSGCRRVVVDGDTKISEPRLWFIACCVAGCLIGTIACYMFFNKKWRRFTPIAMCGLLTCAFVLVVVSGQGKCIVDAEHFEFEGSGLKYNVRFDELSIIEVVKEETGTNVQDRTVIYSANLHKKSGEIQQITLTRTQIQYLWKDVVANAKKRGVVYEDKHGYLASGH